MITSEMKDNYKELIKNLEPRAEVYESACLFIDSYNGPDEDHFHVIVLALISLLCEIQDLKIIKEGFDQIAQSSKHATQELEEIIAKFKELQESKIVVTNPETQK